MMRGKEAGGAMAAARLALAVTRPYGWLTGDKYFNIWACFSILRSF